jgi:hypothetical protein
MGDKLSTKKGCSCSDGKKMFKKFPPKDIKKDEPVIAKTCCN